MGAALLAVAGCDDDTSPTDSATQQDLSGVARDLSAPRDLTTAPSDGGLRD